MFQQIRFRLALWYTLVTAVLLLIFALCFFAYVRLTLIDRVDDTISHISEVLERSLANDPINREVFFQRAQSLEDDHIDLEWFDAQKKLQWTTFSAPLDIPLDLGTTFRTVYPVNSEGLRQLTQVIWFEHELLGYLRISHPWFEVTKPVLQLLLDLTLGVSSTVVTVALCGWWLSGIAMAPVQESYQQLKQFTADISHELRNPLAVIQTNVQVALLETNIPFNARSYLEVIERLSQRMGKLLGDLLFLARHDSNLRREPTQRTSLTAIIQEVLEEQQILAMQKSLELVVKGLQQEIYVEGYPDQLLRLFTNLITNAICFTASGGIVEIIATNKEHLCTVIIKDTGQGISEKALPHIFERYYRQGTEAGTGSGLGLAIAQAIVERHCGTITVESSLDRGTAFTIILPIRSTGS